jgi:hypothetical protein
MKLEIHPSAKSNFNERGEKLVSCVTPHESFMKQSTDYPRPDIYTGPTINEDEITGFTLLGLSDEFGNCTAKLFIHDQVKYGLHGEGYKKLVRLTESIQKTNQLRRFISVETLGEIIFQWVESKFKDTSTAPLSEFILVQCEEIIQEQDIWIPVANLNLQSDITLGNITFRTISRAMLDTYFSERPDDLSPEEMAASNQFESKIRRKYQAFAAATIVVCAEPKRAKEIAFQEAERSLCCLRFFSPANFSPKIVSYTMLKGKEHLELSENLIVKDGRITNIMSALVDLSSPNWLIDNALLQTMEKTGLDQLHRLLKNNIKSDFRESLLDSLILYSKSSVAKEPTDKLIYSLVSLESILLKNSNESIQTNLAERLAFTVGRNTEERKAVIANTKIIYGLRSAFIHHGNQVSLDELVSVEEFMMNTWRFFQWMIVSVDRGLEKNEFFSMLEERKLS